MKKHICRASVLALVAIFSTPLHAEVAFAPEGNVRFMNIANGSFDVYTSNPSPAQKAWMNEHYFRMQVWSPYFDSRLSWYADGWAYKDSYAIHKNSQLAQQHPEWILKDAQGNKLYIPFACSGGSCPQYAGDFGNPAFRAWWIAGAQAIANAGYAGMWIDDVNMTWRVSNGNGTHVKPIDPRTGQQMTLDKWRDYLADFMEEIRAAVPNLEIAHNIIWFAHERTNDNPYVERQIDAADYISLERGVADLGLVAGSGKWGLETFFAFIDYVHGRGRNVSLMDETTSASLRDYALAGWFLVNDGRDIMSTENHNWSAPNSWWTGYDLELGAAVGERYTWNNLLRRDFACGSAFLNQPGRPTVTVQLPQTYTTISGQSVTSLTLGARQGAVLSTSCDNTGSGPTVIERRVTGGANDTEEKSDGQIVTNSTDLELTTDRGVVQTVGMRFTGVNVPQGATITKAWLQFTVDEVSTGSSNLSIRAQADDNAGTLGSNAYNLTARPTTSAAVTWSAPDWPSVGAAGNAQRTPDLASVIQTVTNRAGWQSGNAMVLLIDGNGRRVAESANGNGGAAALLHIEFDDSGSGPPTGGTLDIPVTAGSDDAEESPQGSVSLNDNDLELTTDSGAQQVVGIRFGNVDIPKGATISKAWIQFTADEISTGYAGMDIRAQAANDAPAFSAGAFNISNRATTSAAVLWQPAPWPTVGDAGIAQRTKDFSVVLQAVINRGGWQPGNSVAILFTGTGRRTAESLEGSAAGAPVLHVEFE